MEIIKKKIGNVELVDIFSFTLKNNNGIEVSFINYGGRITSIKTPDKGGNVEEIVLGYDNLADYMSDTAYLGAICGRVAGRIKEGRFFLDGKEFSLTKNDGDHHLHGGNSNFSHAVWRWQVISLKESVMVKLFYESKDKEEGYPGQIDVTVIYELNKDNQFIITYEGRASEKTLINLTNHAYFNLNGNTRDNILNHYLQINSDEFLEIDEEALPTGRLLRAEGTPFDLNDKKQLKKQLLKCHEQLELAKNGYNHPFILNHHFVREIILIEAKSGRKLTVETDCPCVVVYTASYFEDDFEIRGVKASKYLGICLETQGFPDAINHDHFPSIILNKGEIYQSKTSYTFGVI